jgi:hypothetical protein
VARFSPRPASIKAVRKFTWQGAYDYYADGAGRMETRDVSAQFGLDLQTSDTFNVRVSRKYEFLDRPFTIVPRVAIAPGGYSFQDAQLRLGFGNQRRVSGTVTFEGGSFYSGTKKTLSYSAGRVSLSPRLAFEPAASVNWVDLDDGTFTSTVLSNRVTFTFTPTPRIA